jgi:GST-like protein
MNKTAADTLIDLYTAPTPNGRKVSIMLEEIGLPYNVVPIDITAGEQRSKEFTELSPNQKIPAIVDHENNLTLIESGAILMYLAHKTGQLFCQEGEQHWKELEWLMFQMGGVGPMLGQTHHFVKFNPGVSEYAEQRYRKENLRVYKVLEDRLRDRAYLVNEYCIADIATWPWISRFEYQQMDLNAFPNLNRWYLEIAARPAVQRGYAVPQKLEIPLP